MTSWAPAGPVIIQHLVTYSRFTSRRPLPSAVIRPVYPIRCQVSGVRCPGPLFWRRGSNHTTVRPAGPARPVQLYSWHLYNCTTDNCHAYWHLTLVHMFNCTTARPDDSWQLYTCTLVRLYNCQTCWRLTPVQLYNCITIQLYNCQTYWQSADSGQLTTVIPVLYCALLLPDFQTIWLYIKVTSHNGLDWALLNVSLKLRLIYCPPRNHPGVSATGKIRPNVKFSAFWCVFLTKIKVNLIKWPEGQ